MVKTAGTQVKFFLNNHFYLFRTSVVKTNTSGKRQCFSDNRSILPSGIGSFAHIRIRFLYTRSIGKSFARKYWIMALRTLIILLCVFCTQVCWDSTAYGETEDKRTAADVEVKTPFYTPGPVVDFPEGTYFYDVTWQGIPAARASISLDRIGDDYRVVASARTADWVEIIYRLRYRAEGHTSAASFSPKKMLISQTENSKVSSTKISFADSGEIYAVRKKLGKETKTLRFNPHNLTLDPVSAALLARSFDWSEGQEREFDTFNGKTRYLITLKCKKKEQIEIGEPKTKRDVWVISPHVINLVKNERAKKLREVNIYVSADERRDILKIVSEVFIGSVTTKLTNFSPKGSVDRVALN